MQGIATKFWIVCREETPLTQRLVREINEWHMPGVRARLGYRMPLSSEAAIAEADHAIFITLCEHPGNQIKINPVSSRLPNSVQSPAPFLNTIRHRHEKAPNAWWFQVPTTEIRHQGVKYIPLEHTLSQTLSKVELFVRNYVSQHQRVCYLSLANHEKTAMLKAA